MSWSAKPLQDVADFTLGKMLDQAKNRGELLPYLANVNVRWGEFDLTDLREMRFESNEIERYAVRPGDIVMCEGGEPGRCAIWRGERDGVMLQKALHRIRPRPGLDARFLYYFFLHFGMSGAFAPLFTGATIKHLPREQLAKVVVRYPSEPEQKAIAEALSNYDDLIATNQRRIALLEQAARLLYREWFVRLRFPGHESVPMRDSLPEGWRHGTLDQAVFLQRGFDLPNGARVPGDVPVYASTGINGFHNEARVQGPGVVTGRSGTLGQVHYVAEDYWPLNTALWVKEFRQASPLLAYFMLSEMNLGQFNSGASVPTLDRKTAHQAAVLIPPASVVEQFDQVVQPMFDQIQALRSHVTSAAKARDLLLRKLMSGQLDVSRIRPLKAEAMAV